MSHQSMERYLRDVDAWNRGALDEWLKHITSQWELVPAAGIFPDLAPIYRGREGAIALWEAMRGSWDSQGFRLEIERIEDFGEAVLALLTLRAKGKQSGVEVALRWAHVVAERNGDQQIRSYPSWDEARKAVDLRAND